MRTTLLKLLQPIAERFAQEIADAVLVDVEQRFARVRSVLELDEAAEAPRARKAPAREPRKATAKTTSGRKPNSCSKCGAVGFTASTCGRSHNVPTAVDSKPPPSKRTESSGGRFAAIEAAAQRRELAKRQREERSASYVRSRGRPARGVSRAERPDPDEEGRLEPALPEPLSTFDL